MSDEKSVATEKSLSWVHLWTPKYSSLVVGIEHKLVAGEWVIHSWERTQGHWLVPKMLTINHGPKASSIRWLGYPQAELSVFSALVCCASVQDPVKSMELPKVFASCKSFKCQIRKLLIYSISIMFIKQL